MVRVAQRPLQRPDRLKTYADQPATSAVSAVLSINPGIPDGANLFSYVGFKGGSEPGVLSLSWLVQRASDQAWRVYSVELASPIRQNLSGIGRQRSGSAGEVPLGSAWFATPSQAAALYSRARKPDDGTWSLRTLRMRPTWRVNCPVIVSATATPSVANLFQTVTVSAVATDPDGDTLTLTWTPGVAIPNASANGPFLSPNTPEVGATAAFECVAPGSIGVELRPSRTGPTCRHRPLSTRSVSDPMFAIDLWDHEVVERGLKAIDSTPCILLPVPRDLPLRVPLANTLKNYLSV